MLVVVALLHFTSNRHIFCPYPSAACDRRIKHRLRLAKHVVLYFLCVVVDLLHSALSFIIPNKLVWSGVLSLWDMSMDSITFDVLHWGHGSH